jgi:hypothetical protein
MPYVKRRTMRQVAANLLAVLSCLVLSSSLGWSSGRGVSAATPAKSLGTKAVDVDHQYRLDAVTISKVTIADQPIQPGLSSGAREDEAGTPFQANEDWLKNMSISLTNRTDEAIVCAQIQLWFPDTGDGGPGRPVTVYTITVGKRPEWSTYFKDGSKLQPDPNKKPLLLAAGQTLTIPIADYIDQIQSSVEENISFSKVTRVNIRRFKFYFVGGMTWDDTGFSVPDNAHRGKYTKLAPTYFPGHPPN